MKKFLFLGSLLISGSLLGQNKMSCCSKTDATEEFAVFASDKNFMATHENPLPFVFHSDNGKDIQYKTDDGTDAHAWEIKPAKSPSRRAAPPAVTTAAGGARSPPTALDGRHGLRFS